MNVVQDMLFQQMQMLAAGMSLPQTGGSDGKTNFQSVMDQTRGESQAVKEPEKQQNTEETEKTEPARGGAAGGSCGAGPRASDSCRPGGPAPDEPGNSPRGGERL